MKRNQRDRLYSPVPPVMFEAHNMGESGGIKSEERTYGLMRASKTYTPYPAIKENVDADLLAHRLEAVNQRSAMHLDFNSKVGLTTRKDFKCSSPTGSSDSMVSFIDIADNDTFEQNSVAEMRAKAFAEKRQKFHEAEFTITRGKKLSDFMSCHHQSSSVVQKATTNMNESKLDLNFLNKCYEEIDLDLSQDF